MGIGFPGGDGTPGGGAGGGGGGLPGVLLKQSGETIKGLILGLGIEDAGADWALNAAVRRHEPVLSQAVLDNGGAGNNPLVIRLPHTFVQPSSVDADGDPDSDLDDWHLELQVGQHAVAARAAVQATVSVGNGLGGTATTGRLVFTMPAGYAVGAAGNAWRINVGVGATSVSSGVNEVIVRFAAGLTLTQVKALIDASSWGGSVAIDGSADAIWVHPPSPQFKSPGFTGGVNAVAAVARDPLTAVLDTQLRRITLTCVATDTIAQVATALRAMLYDIRFGVGPADPYVALPSPYATGRFNEAGLVTYNAGAQVLDASYFSRGVGSGIGAVFTTGTDIEGFEATVDVDAMRIGINYASVDSIQQVHDYYNDREAGDAVLGTTIVAGTDASAALEAAPIVGRALLDYFAPGGLPDDAAAEVTTLRSRLDNLTFGDITGQLADGQIPDAIARDAEITESFLLGVLGLSAQELDDVFVGATVTGAGASRVITVTQADGTTITLSVPDTTGGGGGGGADGVVTGASFSADGTTLILRLSTGAGVTANVPALLRTMSFGGMLSTQVLDESELLSALSNFEGSSNTLLWVEIEGDFRWNDAARDMKAGDIFVKSATGTNTEAWLRTGPRPRVDSKNANYQLRNGDLGRTIRLTGATARTFTTAAGIPAGWWARLLNSATAVLTLDVGVTARIEGAGQTVEIAAGDCVTVQYLGTSVWAVVTDTAGEAGDGGTSSAPRELEVLADARSTVAGSTPSGQTTLQLPATYTEYKNFEVVVGDDANTIEILRGTTAWLALQQDGDGVEFGLSDKDEAGSRHWATWTPSTRTFAFGNQGTSGNMRFKAARLYDGGGGAAGGVADGTLTPAAFDADTAAKQKAFREAVASAHIGSGLALPLAANTNVGDVWIFPQGVANGLSWRDISDQNTVITSADAGDVGLYIGARGWVRVGNIYRRQAGLAPPFSLFISPGHVDKGNIPGRFEVNLYLEPSGFTTVTKAEITIAGVAQTQDVTFTANPWHSFQVAPTSAMRDALAALTDNGSSTVLVRLLDASDVEQAQITAEIVAVPAGSGSGGTGLDQTARDGVAEALLAIMSNSDRMEVVEALLVDMDLVVDGPVVWANAAVADAQFAYTWNLTSAAARKVATADPADPFDPAADIVAANFRTSSGSIIWATARSVAADAIILVRVKKGLPSIQFRTRLDGIEHILQGYTLRGSDANWDYYYGGSTAGASAVDVAVQRRSRSHHTAYQGELAGRALDKVNELIGDHPSAWPGSVYVIPHELPTESGETTFRAFVQVPDDLYPTGTRMRIDMAGTKGAIVGINAGPATHTLNAGTVRNSLQTRDADGYVRGTLEIIESGSTNLIDRIDFQIPIVQSGKWRPLAGSSPYTVRVTDDEFMFVTRHTGDSVEFNGVIPRVRLATSAKNFGVSSNRVDSGANAHEWVGVAASLNAAGTELTIAEAGDGVSNYTLDSVLAR